MRNVVFVAPFLMEATNRFVRSVASVPGARTVLLTQDPVENVPEAVRPRLHGHWRIDDCMDPRQVADAVTAIAAKLGNVGRVIGTLEQLQVPLAEARAALGIEGMDPATAANFRDKSRMKDVLRAAGVPCARHRLAADAQQAREAAREIGFPIVLKPPAGAGARSTYRVDGPEELDRTVAVLRPSRGREVLLEEFVVGEESSFDTVSIGGRSVWHSLSHYRPTPLEVLRNDWIQWCVQIPREVDDPRYDDIRRVASAALGALGMHTGVTHMEWFRRRDGSLAVSEVAARPPGAQFCSLIGYAHDIDFYAAWAELAVFGTFRIPERKYSAGAAYLRGQGTGRVKAVHGLDQAQRELGQLVVEASLPRAGQSPSGTYEGEGYVILRHADSRVVADGLRRLVSLVRVELG